MTGNSTIRQLALSWSLGWRAAIAVFAAVSLLGLALDRFDEFTWIFAPLAAGAVTNAVIFLSAALVGQTRQVRPLWATLALGFCVYLAASYLHWSWARDLFIVGCIGLFVLGLPSSLTWVAILKLQSLSSLTLDVAESLLCLLILPYLQHFVLLPMMFTKRRSTRSAST